MPVILVIDGDSLIRLLLRTALERGDHRMLEAEDEAVGLRLFRAQPPDLVLGNLFMPVKDGLETISEVRRLRPSLPVVAMSGGSRNRTDFLPAAGALGPTTRCTSRSAPSSCSGSSGSA
jgi:CheY-like chemotaxis protein